MRIYIPKYICGSTHILHKFIWSVAIALAYLKEQLLNQANTSVYFKHVYYYLDAF